ncbi:MAG: hypothetical protein QXG39_00735 [Candidatus Aenigmatarchaeota archaeon]
MRRAVLIAFSVRSEKFQNFYERNKFFRELYGWKQMIKRGSGQKKRKEKVYVYRREGLLTEIPHKKIDQSTFIIPEDEFRKMEEFMREWEKKVIWNVFKILLEEDIFGEY